MQIIFLVKCNNFRKKNSYFKNNETPLNIVVFAFAAYLWTCLEIAIRYILSKRKRNKKIYLFRWFITKENQLLKYKRQY